MIRTVFEIAIKELIYFGIFSILYGITIELIGADIIVISENSDTHYIRATFNLYAGIYGYSCR